MVNNDQLKQMIHEIKLQYSNQMYQKISGDTFFKNVPQKLWKLWYSDEDHSLAICNLDNLFLKLKNGEEDTERVREKVSCLRCALAHEFELLIKQIF